MALKALLDNVDGLDDNVKALYKEANGKFVLDVEPAGGFALEDVTGLKKVKDEAIAGRDTLKGKLSDFEKELTTLKRANAELKAGQSGELEDRIVSLRTELTDLHQAEMKVVSEERDSLNGELETTIFDSSLKDALAELGATSNGRKYLPAEIKKHVKFSREGNKSRFDVVDSNGNVRSSVDKPGESMGILELVALDIAPDNKELFTGNEQSGSGAHGLNGAGNVGNTMKTEQFNSLSSKEKAKIQDEGKVTVID